MEVLYKRCCGIDIHKNMMVACIFTSVRKKEIRQFSTMTEDILQLVSWLKETDCEMAAMESTGSYWKPVYNIFEEEQIPIMVVNAQHIKGVPGRKTDVKDAEWIRKKAGGRPSMRSPRRTAPTITARATPGSIRGWLRMMSQVLSDASAAGRGCSKNWTRCSR